MLKHLLSHQKLTNCKPCCCDKASFCLSSPQLRSEVLGDEIRFVCQNSKAETWPTELLINLHAPCLNIDDFDYALGWGKTHGLMMTMMVIN